MTTLEALALVDDACSRALLNRQDHVEVQRAILALKAIVDEHAMLKQAVNETVEAATDAPED
jgi:hypothetical protein